MPKSVITVSAADKSAARAFWERTRALWGQGTKDIDDSMVTELARLLAHQRVERGVLKAEPGVETKVTTFDGRWASRPDDKDMVPHLTDHTTSRWTVTIRREAVPQQQASKNRFMRRPALRVVKGDGE